MEDREEIFAGITRNLSDRVIASGLGRCQSVISREIARNDGRAGYSPSAATARCALMAARPRSRKLEVCRRLHDEVAGGLARCWSPQQISARLRVDHRDDEAMWVSHETIYQALYLQARGQLRTELKVALRTGRAVRRPHGSTRPKQARIADMVNIAERPAEAADRAVPGHWEGDLIIGKAGKSQVATLVERTTRFTLLVRVPYDRTADRVAVQLSGAVKALPAALRRSLTWDQGVEMAAHARFSLTTGVPVYFCDPHSPWQRGSNENTNGLIRQFLPKGTDLSGYTQTQLDEISDMLNGRPRETLAWRTPAEKLNEFLAVAGDALTN